MKYRDKNGVLHEVNVIKGESAFESAQIGGYSGTEEEFYQRLGDMATNEDIANTKAEIDTQVSQLSEQIVNEQYEYSIDKDDMVIGTIQYADGGIAVNEEAYTTPFIRINEGDTVNIIYATYDDIIPKFRIIAFEEDYKNAKKYQVYGGWGTIDKFTMPAGYKYVRISYRLTSVKVAQYYTDGDLKLTLSTPILHSKIEKIENKVNEIYESTIDTFPPYYHEEYEQTMNTVKEHLLDSDTTFGFMSDLHFSAKGSDYFESDLRDRIGRIMNCVAKFTGDYTLDAFVLGGDYQQQPTKEKGQTKQMGVDNILEINEYRKNINCPSIAIAGNHEENYAGGGDSYGLTDDEIYKILGKNIQEPIKKASDRVYYLLSETSEVVYVYISTTRTFDTLPSDIKEGLDKVVAENTNNYPMILFNHFACYWEKDTYYDNPKTCIDYLKSKDCSIIAWIGGHTHIDWNVVYNDTLIISLISACCWNTDRLGVTDKQGNVYVNHINKTANESAFSICQVDKTHGKLYVTRFGAGHDLEFNYNNTSGEIGFVKSSN